MVAIILANFFAWPLKRVEILIVCSLPCRTMGTPVMVTVGPRFAGEAPRPMLPEAAPTKAITGKKPMDERKG